MKWQGCSAATIRCADTNPFGRAVTNLNMFAQFFVNGGAVMNDLFGRTNKDFFFHPAIFGGMHDLVFAAVFDKHSFFNMAVFGRMNHLVTFGGAHSTRSST